jgi:hypothetical protein
MPKKKNTWRRQYRKGRSKAHRDLERQATNAVMTGKGLIEDQLGDGFVYVIRLGIGNLYKIGCTRDVKARMKALMAANPNLTLVFAVRVKSRLAGERALHTRFAEKRQSGELFDLSESDLNGLAQTFSNAETALHIDDLKVERAPKLQPGFRRCSSCGAEFLPAKSYWWLCENCMKGSSNKTQAGWSRWRNLRTETHIHGKG